MTLKIGQITYVNCAPFFHYLRKAGFRGKVIHGVPAELNRLLALGEIDASPSSSFEYGLHWHDYLLLPNLSISSIGPVRSVLFFSGEPLATLSGKTVWVTGESATSVNLLKVLLQEFYGAGDITFRVPGEPIETLLAGGRPTLFIGDRALRANTKKPEWVTAYDLGELWYQFTGLPFVFALWILRRDTAESRPEEVSALLNQLEMATERALKSLSHLAQEGEYDVFLEPEDLIDYWMSMSYRLTEGHLEGLRLFFTLCEKHGVLNNVPQLAFFSES